MLQRLEIKNYAIIKALEIEFSAGLNIITGETGAGKSILMGAVGLLLGERADSKVLFDQDQKCLVEGVFRLASPDLRTWFTDHDLDYANELVIRREVNAQGKSRAFINDSLVNLPVLKELASTLVDVHGQFDTLDIHHEGQQFDILDALGQNEGPLKSYREALQALQNNQQVIQNLKHEITVAQQENDFLRFQQDELTKIHLVNEEEKTLDEELRLLSAAADIQAQSQAALALLDEGDYSASQYITQARQKINSLGSILPAFKDLSSRLEATIVEINDISKALAQLAEARDADPKRQTFLEDRLGVLHRLFQKYKVHTSGELLKILDGLNHKLRHTEGLEDQLQALNEEGQRLEIMCRQDAKLLSSRRQKQAKYLEQEVKKLLIRLAMPEGDLQVRLTDTVHLNRYGCDQVEFLFAANAGSKPLPIRAVASGGELSRLNLCIKSVVADKMVLPTLIFDEIDSGISGPVAEKMGQVMQALAQKHQIITITHSPQVASKANNHFQVYKTSSSGRVQTMVKPLSGEERVHALAVMLSTDPPSTPAMANARELLNLQKK